MTWAEGAEVANVALAIVVLAVTVGRSFGKLETRQQRRTRELQPEESNGSPSVGELERRLKELRDEFHEDRREYLPRKEAELRFGGVWGAIKELRSADSFQNTRIDRLKDSR